MDESPTAESNNAVAVSLPGGPLVDMVHATPRTSSLSTVAAVLQSGGRGWSALFALSR